MVSIWVKLFYVHSNLFFVVQHHYQLFTRILISAAVDDDITNYDNMVVSVLITLLILLPIARTSCVQSKLIGYVTVIFQGTWVIFVFVTDRHNKVNGNERVADANEVPHQRTDLAYGKKPSNIICQLLFLIFG